MTETTLLSPVTVFQQMAGAFNAGDRERFAAIFSADARASTADGEAVTGPEAITTWMWAYHDAFSDIAVEIVESLENGHRGAVVLRSTGTQRADLKVGSAGVPATGNRVSWTACYMFTIRDGQIERLEVYTDSRHFQRQLER